MKIIDCEQKSEEWFKLRAKRLTASHAQAIGNAKKGLDTYILEKMSAYYSTAERDTYNNKDMARGNDLEDSAATIYSFEQHVDVKKVGFVVLNDYVGVSPDLFVQSDGLAEIKCPNDKTYFQLLMDFKIDSSYLWQMQMQMLCCNKKWCNYVVYNPNFKENLLIQHIPPDPEMQNKLLDGFKIGEEKIKEIVKKMERK